MNHACLIFTLYIKKHSHLGGYARPPPTTSQLHAILPRPRLTGGSLSLSAAASASTRPRTAPTYTWGPAPLHGLLLIPFRLPPRGRPSPLLFVHLNSRRLRLRLSLSSRRARDRRGGEGEEAGGGRRHGRAGQGGRGRDQRPRAAARRAGAPRRRGRRRSRQDRRRAARARQDPVPGALRTRSSSLARPTSLSLATDSDVSWFNVAVV